MESWIVAMTFGVFAMGSPRRRMAAVSVAATRSAPFMRSSEFGWSGMRRAVDRLHRLVELRSRRSDDGPVTA